MSRTPHPQFTPDPHRVNIIKRSPTAALLIVLGAVVVIAGTVYLLVAVVNKKAPTAPAQQPAPQQPASVPPVPADDTVALPPARKVSLNPQVTATAEVMIDAYTRSEESAQGRGNAAASAPATQPIPTADPGYRGKIIEVTGRVYGKGDSEFTGRYIALGGGVERTRGVHCALSPENVEQLGAISKGQTVIVRGLCKELAKDIELVDCAVIKIVSTE